MHNCPSNFCAAPLTRGFPSFTAVSDKRYRVGALSVQSRMTSAGLRIDMAFSTVRAQACTITLHDGLILQVGVSFEEGRGRGTRTLEWPPLRIALCSFRFSRLYVEFAEINLITQHYHVQRCRYSLGKYVERSTNATDVSTYLRRQRRGIEGRGSQDPRLQSQQHMLVVASTALHMGHFNACFTTRIRMHRPGRPIPSKIICRPYRR